jgi:hypothetical protein
MKSNEDNKMENRNSFKDSIGRNKHDNTDCKRQAAFDQEANMRPWFIVCTGTSSWVCMNRLERGEKQKGTKELLATLNGQNQWLRVSFIPIRDKLQMKKGAMLAFFSWNINICTRVYTKCGYAFCLSADTTYCRDEKVRALHLLVTPEKGNHWMWRAKNGYLTI